MGLLADIADAHATAVRHAANPDAWRTCPARGEKIGERECKTCKGRVRLHLFACPDHPEGVTLKDCENCRRSTDCLRISAIATARNEGSEVVPTLESLMAAGADEVILVDDGSTDGSCAPEKLPAGTILVRNDVSQGVGVARCQGIERATGNVCAMFDAHERLKPGSLREPCQVALERGAFVVLTVEPLGDEKHAKIGTGYGARLKLDRHGSHYTTQYISKPPAERFSPIDGPIGAAYIGSREALKRIGGWLDLPGYGGCEQALALRAWFTDTPILVDRDCRNWHLFGSPHNYTSAPVWLNWLRIAFVHFEEKTFRSFWLPNITRAWPDAAKYWPPIEAEQWAQKRRAQFQALRKHSDEEWARHVRDNRLLPFVAAERPTPLVSVMMPAYNVGKYIAQAIESVKAQTWPNWGLVIVDDASTDDTLAVAQRYAKDDPRIRVLHLAAHTNCPRARNEAVKMCKGEFIARLDADDWDEPTRLERSIRWLQENPTTDVVSCRMIEHSGKTFEKAKLSACSPVCASVVARREVYDAVKFREQLRNGSDSAWNTEAQHAGFRFGEILDPLYHYRIARPGGVTMTRKKVVWFANMPKSYFTKDARHPERLRHLLRTIPDLFDYKTLLYVGANKRRCDLVPTFCLAGYEVDVVEIFDPYLAELRELNAETKWFRRIIPGDVLDLAALVDRPYDVVLWWHGPEHVESSDLPRALDQMTRVARRLAVIGAPHGRMEQGPVDGNPRQRHVWDPMPEAFAALGWQASTLWPRPSPQSHLVAWKKP